MGAKKVLIIGGDGFLGNALRLALPSLGWNVTATSRRIKQNGLLQFDLEDRSTYRTIQDDFYAVILCAAMSKIAECERDPARARMINVERTLEVAAYFLDQGSYLIYPSTNQVFNGSVPSPQPTDPISPCTTYGRVKAEVEQGLLIHSQNAAVVRITKILGASTPLIKNWVETLYKKQSISPFSDVYCAPVSDQFVVTAFHNLLTKRLAGIFHLSGQVDITYASIAAALADAIEAPPALVAPKPSVEITSERLFAPRYTALNVSDTFSKLKLVTESLPELIQCLVRA